MRRSEGPTPRLVSVDVRGLLGRFDHHVDFPADWDFAILHGPNGVGKTKLLQLIVSALGLDVRGVRSTPFDSAEFRFDDNHILSIEKVPRQEFDLEFTEGRDDADRASQVEFILHRPDGALARWPATEQSQELIHRLQRLIERSGRYTRVGVDKWRDLRTREALDTYEVIERTPNIMPPSLRGVTYTDAPLELREFSESLSIHLIQTQRLTVGDPSQQNMRNDRDDVSHRPTVVQYAEDLKDRLQRALASNSGTTQQLDRSFPKRVLDAILPHDVNDDLIREKYQAQSRLRKRLAQIALLEDRTDLPLPDRELKDWERRVLWTYLEDTDEKLATFDFILKRVDALRDIINSHFLYKELVVDAEFGFMIVTDEGKTVPAASLSSGEQHELILLYDLLFNAVPNSLVLIDEPEISLHVAWQQQFLKDLTIVSDIASLRFLIATHSPQIIHKSWSRTIRLAPQFTDSSVSDRRD